MEPSRILADLKRRKVFRVAAVYVVAAWLVLQVGDIVVEPLQLPAWTLTLLIVFVALGFPIAVVLAWAFEVTRDGVRRTEGGALDAADGETGKAPDADTPDLDSAAAPAMHRDPQGRLVAGVGIGILVGLVGFGAYGWLTFREPAPPAPASRTAIAVLPFAVDGSGEIAYLRDGLVKILAAKLDGAAEFRSVDPNALLAHLAGDTAALGPDRAGEVAARFGAGRFILGSVVELGTVLLLEAALYDGEGGREPVVRATAEGSPDEVLALIDQLATRLLAGQFTDPGTRLAQSAALTTRSLSALKEYLTGEARMRDGEYGRAAESFQRAVEIDTAFALAWYRLADAAGWEAQWELATRALDAAQRHSGELSPLDRALIVAKAAYARGDFAAAEATYRRLVAEYPDNVEAWYQLGETLFHGNLFRGRPPTEAWEPFRRAAELDPDNAELISHLHGLVLTDTGIEDLDSVFAHQDAATRERTRPLVELLRLAHGAPEDRARALELLRVLPFDTAAWHAVYALRLGPTEFVDSALAILRGRGSATRYAGFTYISRDRGRWTQADSLDLATAGPGARMNVARVTALLPRVPRRRVEWARDELRSWEPASFPGSAQPAWVVEAVRTYVDALLALKLDQEDDATRAATELARTAGRDTAYAPLFHRLVDDLRARLAWRDGEPERALAILDARDDEPYPVDAYVARAATGYVSYLDATRWLRAELLLELGRDAEALGWYSGFPGLDYSGLGPLATLRMAEIHERAGRVDEATRRYARFLDLWSDPDPYLLPIVEDARRSLARLTEEASP